uniref:Uncharacterized protein n=1 Tax=Klebsiella pneumoniae TaxID=573 RepID=A0A8B0SPP3_KLEPN|nr:hypothetical protein [Klebsiella pneumoniae]
MQVFILWGDSEALNELHELIHYIVDESPLIKVKDGFMLSLAYDIRKAREGNRRVEQHQYDQHDTYKLYGVELFMASGPWYSPQYSETQWVIFRQTKKPAVCHVCL